MPVLGNAYTVGFSDGAGQGSRRVSVGQTYIQGFTSRKIT